MIYREHADPMKNELLKYADTASRLQRPVEIIARRLTRFGNFLLVGTVQSQLVHEPKIHHQHYDTDLKAWVTDTNRPVNFMLYATDIGGIAILSGLFGDINEYDQRQRLGIPLTDADRPHYGWDPDPPYAYRRDMFEYYALPELISTARKLGPELQGSIDVIDKPKFLPYIDTSGDGYPQYITESPIKPPPGIQYGSYNLDAAQTYMTLPVNGTDLPLGIKPLVLSDGY